MNVQIPKSAGSCSLCFVPCDGNFHTLDEVPNKMLETLLIKPDIYTNKLPIICKSCGDNLELCYYFKSSCLDTEDYIRSFESNQDNTKLDILQIYLNKNGNENSGNFETSTVCRLCFKLVKNHDCICLNEENKDVPLLEIIITQYFPEIDLNVTGYPAICKCCQTSLQSYFTFVKKYPRIEQDLQEYRKDEISKSDQNWDLKSIIKCENDNASLDVPKRICDREFSDDIKSRNERVFGMDSQELNIKAEEVIIKDEHDWNRNQKGNADSESTRMRTFQCEKCEYKAKRKSHLKAHAIVHQDPSQIKFYQCELCPFKTKWRHGVKSHMMTHKDVANPTYKCHRCSFETSVKLCLEDHLANHRNTPDFKRHSCNLCDYKAKRKFRLKEHMMVHLTASEIRPEKCEVCPYTAKYKCDIRKHVLLNHKDPSEASVYQCELCTYKTIRKSLFNSHLAVHGGETCGTTYHCEVCSYKTVHRGNLPKHMLTHKNESEVKLHRCSLCDYKTKHKQGLQRHMLVHTDGPDVRAYQCAVCDFKSKRKNTLQKHMLLHLNDSEVTVYQCELCEFTTRYKYYIKRHVTSHKIKEQNGLQS